MARGADTRFDGMHVYTMLSTDPAVYDVRGQYFHRAGRPGTAVYQIRGDHVYRTCCRYSELQPFFEIRGNEIHTSRRASQMIYEVR